MTTPYASEAFLHQLLGKALAAGVTDVHLKVGQPPGGRVGDALVYFRVDVIRPEDTEAVARVLLAGRAGAMASLEQVLAYEAPGTGRFRVSLYRQRGSLSVVMRAVPGRVPALDELGLPPAVKALIEGPAGLIVVAGPARSGKTTTAAALLGHLNASFARHLITVEDPIEILHQDARSSVSQREVGTDTASLCTGLAAALRQDADLLFAGALPSAEALELALDAVDAGTHVVTTLPAPDARRALERLLALDPTARDRVADALGGLVAQRLVPQASGGGLALEGEVLVATAEVREAIRRGGSLADGWKALSGAALQRFPRGG